MLKIAFAGFRHGHIMGFYNACKGHPQVKLVAACEEDPETIDSLRGAGKVDLTHASLSEMLKTADCDAVAVGDYFAKRGSVIIESLKAGKHVIADKPVCTSLDELREIAGLVQSKKLRLGCLLDLRDSGVFIAVRRMIQSGQIGQVLSICITAQHPLFLSSRPKWYFDPGKQGGTINDLGIHAVDLIAWLTRQPVAEAVAAREWNARVPQLPHFHDGAQMMLKLKNGAGILSDLSYFTPDGLAYAAPQYWRLTIHGTEGLIEADFAQRKIAFAGAADKAPRAIEPEADVVNGRLEAFLREIAGDVRQDDLTTADVLDATRRTLIIQRAADRNQHNVSLDM